MRASILLFSFHREKPIGLLSVPPECRAGIVAFHESPMGREVNMARELVINGTSYRSLEDVPPGLREAVRGALASKQGESTVGCCREILVNGKRYDDVRPMPDAVSEMYAAAMQYSGSGKGIPAGKPPAGLQPIVPQGSSSRWLLLGGLLFCLLVSLLLLLLPR